MLSVVQLTEKYGTGVAVDSEYQFKILHQNTHIHTHARTKYALNETDIPEDKSS